MVVRPFDAAIPSFDSDISLAITTISLQETGSLHMALTQRPGHRWPGTEV
jgi:hypothetical protein